MNVLLFNGQRVSTDESAGGRNNLEMQAFGICKLMNLEFTGGEPPYIHSIWTGPYFRPKERGDYTKVDRLIMFREPESCELVSSVINSVAESHLKKKPRDGGCYPFRSPIEWEERKEKYGLDAELIVCHDGGDYAQFFNHDYENYKAIDAMDKSLSELGYWAEPCTSWYTAIYKRKDA